MASSARCIAAVAELTATAYFAPTYSASSRSKRLVRGPVVSQPLLSVSTTSAISSSSMQGRWKGSQVARYGEPPSSARRSAIIVSSCWPGPRRAPGLRRSFGLDEHHQLVRPQQRDRLQQLAEQPASCR